ncbi:hypothetical protein [Streptomyces sp. NBC_00083]|uniref:hypothetical protein n=1 Tax=Streptomyces sp. NBC_00083 TaxID=2975647 RepID=UPI002259AEC6|nr:hypothetical protein [Streptomyces sp. NBC_00083]MCX5384711.1 hypothetical protein [Streptomyces sp. NBC_00083]
MASLCVAVVLATWLLLTAAAALPRLGQTVRGRLPAWCVPLLPSWTFFAPNPATKDKVLMYRDVLANGTFGPLRLVLPEGGARGRPGKALFDAASHLVRQAAHGWEEEDARTRDAHLMISTSYLVLLNRAASAAHDATAIGFAFVIAHASLRDEAPEVVFVSAVHRLENAAEGVGAWDTGVREGDVRESGVREGNRC